MEAALAPRKAQAQLRPCPEESLRPPVLLEALGLRDAGAALYPSPLLFLCSAKSLSLLFLSLHLCLPTSLSFYDALPRAWGVQKMAGEPSLCRGERSGDPPVQLLPHLWAPCLPVSPWHRGMEPGRPPQACPGDCGCGGGWSCGRQRRPGLMSALPCSRAPDVRLPEPCAGRLGHLPLLGPQPAGVRPGVLAGPRDR